MLMLILKRFLFHPIISLIDKRKQIISKEKNEYLSLCKLIDKQKNKIEVRLNTVSKR